MLTNVTKNDRALNYSDLEFLEKQLNLKLPEDYKSFLLKYNGGIPKESLISFNGAKLKISGMSIKRFYGVCEKKSNDILHNMNSSGELIPKGTIYISNTHGGNYFLISLRDDSYGQVYYKDHEFEDTLPFDPINNLLPESIVKVTDNFDEFLSRLSDPDED